jgi:hypothetical protein
MNTMLQWTHDYGTNRSEASGRRGKYVITQTEWIRDVVWWQTEFIPSSSRRRSELDDFAIAYEPTFLEAMRAAEEHHAERTKPIEW